MPRNVDILFDNGRDFTPTLIVIRRVTKIVVYEDNKHALICITSTFRDLRRTVWYRIVLSLFDMVERKVLITELFNCMYDNESILSCKGKGYFLVFGIPLALIVNRTIIYECYTYIIEEGKKRDSIISFPNSNFSIPNY